MESVMETQDSPYQEGKKRLLLDTKAALDDVLSDPKCPVFLHSALCGKLTWQKRSEFSIARTLAAPGLAPQWIGMLLAWGARIVLADGKEMMLEEALETPGQIRTASKISLPLDVPGRIWAEARTGSTPDDFPIVWAAAVIDQSDGKVNNARIAISGATRRSVALLQSAAQLVGKPLDVDSIQNMAAAAVEEADPVGDYRGSAEYRRAMAGVMVRRALESCLEGVEA